MAASGIPTTITRQHLYEEIWRKSMKRVAAELGISRMRLIKICDHFAIPYPRHIRRGSDGRSAPPLLPWRSAAPDTFTITSPRARLGPEALPVTQTRIERGPDFDAPQHPELKKWIREYLKRRAEFAAWRANHPQLGPYEAVGADPSVLRMFKIVNHIFRAAHTRGLIPVLSNPGGLGSFRFMYQGAPIYCELRQPRMRVRKKVAGVERTELQDTGQLLFIIRKLSADDLPPRTEWHEKKVGPLEQHIETIVETLVLVGPAALRTHQQRLERERISDEQQSERFRKAREMQSESIRRRALYKAAARYRIAREARRLLEDLEALEHDIDQVTEGLSVRDWLIWARAQLEIIDPLSAGISGFFERIAQSAKR